MSVVSPKKSIAFDSDDDKYWTESSTKKRFDFDGEDDIFFDGNVVTISGLQQSESSKKPSAVSFLPSPEKKNSLKITSNLASFIEVPARNENRQQIIEKNVTPKNTIKSLILGLPYTFEQHKSKEAKLELLDEAIKWHDGDAILACVVFLKQTLKPAIFNRELILRPRALNHYVKYLKLKKQYTILADFLSMLGRHEELAVSMYAPASSSSHAQTKLNNLLTFQKNYLRNDSDLTFISNLVQEHISLLQKQMVIDGEDSKSEIEGKNLLFRDYPRNTPLSTTPVITTLYYCCFYHYNLAENIISSPLHVRIQHQLTDKQFTWTALKALAILKLWPDIEKLFLTKSWIGGKKMRCCIGFDRVVFLLKEHQAPKEVIILYLNLIEDQELRMEVAKDLHYHRTVIDILVAARDRLAVIEYKAELQRQKNLDHRYAEESLKASSIKWKN